ncbi:MAG TPA: hypothetical protein VKM54_15970 [Myxococcota bacterium]|nr:hypothetical protein [Myxococcota bacterium]
MATGLVAYHPLHRSAALGHAHVGGHHNSITEFLTHNPILSRVRAPFSGPVDVRARAVESGHMLRQSAETVVTAGLLGLLHVEMPRGGLDQMKGRLPVDGAVAVAGFGLSWLAAGHDSNVSSDLRNVGATALGILTFRKAFAFAAEKKLHSGGAVGGSFGPAATGAPRPLGAHGDIHADPIVRAARAL